MEGATPPFIPEQLAWLKDKLPPTVAIGRETTGETTGETALRVVPQPLPTGQLEQGGGGGKPTAHAHVIMFDALPIGRTACRVRR